MSDETLNENHSNIEPRPDESPERAVPVPAQSEQRFVFTPMIDIFETDEGLELYADLPGVSAETLEVQVQDNKLTLFGRVKSFVDEASPKVLHQEYQVGDFLRSFILSDNVDHERISAHMSNGVLKVVLPRAAETEARKIHINSD